MKKGHWEVLLVCIWVKESSKSVMKWMIFLIFLFLENWEEFCVILQLFTRTYLVEN